MGLGMHWQWGRCFVLIPLAGLMHTDVYGEVGLKENASVAVWWKC